MSRPRALLLVVLTFLLSGIGLPARAASGTSSSGSRLLRPAALSPRLPLGSTRVGALDPARPIAFEVVPAPSHPQELESLLSALYNPRSTQYEHWVPPGEFQRRFGPSPAEVARIVGWLHRSGFPDAQLVDGKVRGRTTARVAARAFGVSLGRYRLANGRQAFSAEEAPLIPSEVVGDITSILGLSDTSVGRPHHTLAAHGGSIRPTTAGGARSCAKNVEQQANELSGWSTRQVDAAYQVPKLLNSGLTGAGQTIALYELAPHTDADVSAYLDCFGLHNPVATKLVAGGSDTDPGGTVEANLDIEAAAATAPGAKIVSYEGQNTARGVVDTWAAIVNDDTAQVISTSWGLCEPHQSGGERNAMHALFEQAAVQGQTVFAASGDSGSEGCFFEGSTALAVDAPANDPYVTAVGGSSQMPNRRTYPHREPVWNDCNEAIDMNCAFNYGGAAGGGLSDAFAKPAWQPIAAGSPCGSGCRQVPDISANAGVGEAFLSGGHWYLIGGTSIASPKLAGIAADVAGGCVDGLGAFNPKVYALARAGAYDIALRDIPAGEGNIDLTRDHRNQFETADGFDLATGLGTPIATGLACPEVARLTPATAAPGARVTITGLALARATIRFGRTPAKVLSRTTTTATVIVPVGTGRQPVSASDPIGHGTYRAVFTYRTTT